MQEGSYASLRLWVWKPLAWWLITTSPVGWLPKDHHWLYKCFSEGQSGSTPTQCCTVEYQKASTLFQVDLWHSWQSQSLSSGASSALSYHWGKEFHCMNDSQLSHFISEATRAQPASHASVSCVRDVSVTEISTTIFICVGAGMFAICSLFLLLIHTLSQPL